MAQSIVFHVMLLMVVTLAAVGVTATPPGIANNPSQATCKDPSYKQCHNLVHVCPKFCDNGCYVHCQSCKPICNGSPAPSTPEIDTPPQSPPEVGSPPQSPPEVESPPQSPPEVESPPQSPPEVESPPQSPPEVESPPQSPPMTPLPATDPSPPTPSLPPPTTPSPPTESTPPTSSSPPIESTPPTTPPTTPSPPTESTPPTPSSPPTESTPPTPPTTPSPPTESTPPTPSSPPTEATPPTQSSPPPTTPSPPTLSSPPPPTSTPSPPTWYPAPPTKPKKAKCKNNKYEKCYSIAHTCPASCPNQCTVDCVACKPVCTCDMPGAVCQDPRFIGADGITFYFHGKKDKDFCLVTDNNLHINGHFIGKRNQNMSRDFTWVQSIGILFDNHKLQISAKKTSIWNDEDDRISIMIDGERIYLPESEDAKWKSSTLSITRIQDTNNVVVEVENMFKITAKVVPITKEDSRIHNYGITDDDCFAHLDLKFKFFSLSDEVDGVLGQTYKSDYVSKVKMGVLMPVMGGNNKFESADLFTTDCSVAKFKGSREDVSSLNLEFPSLKCQSGLNGRGVVCKR